MGESSPSATASGCEFIVALFAARYLVTVLCLQGCQDIPCGEQRLGMDVLCVILLKPRRLFHAPYASPL
ncbi:Uncharacterised protein [Leminorella richardii]|uniref:Uncharacterized protein n=1 Tax=Leminorella richardii TaxID=158841 RepID=A0A2X4USZ6_9GAMM|nr:Uncharacterised protein [Leminorella richardii]